MAAADALADEVLQSRRAFFQIGLLQERCAILARFKLIVDMPEARHILGMQAGFIGVGVFGAIARGVRQHALLQRRPTAQLAYRCQLGRAAQLIDIPIACRSRLLQGLQCRLGLTGQGQGHGLQHARRPRLGAGGACRGELNRCLLEFALAQGLKARPDGRRGGRLGGSPC
ncbi:hypothetical protein RQP53_04940 [Paucibacter sp. APW11]|uniref:Uncharacterized protein n=1 Tax=Roseateles aquae TaxID=3077235 RepID=A0ABU3P7R7_9BURK|nr:hypothetical protein [Paucibacter sp. APW11]MDT8998613.1 hypothetical protein [Paucibacter sp. APW11]